MGVLYLSRSRSIAIASLPVWNFVADDENTFPETCSEETVGEKMSLRPFMRSFWDDPWEGLGGHPSRLYDQFFGDPVASTCLCPAHVCCRPLYGQTTATAQRQLPQETGFSEVSNNKKEFRVKIDVQHFRPGEISIMTKGNRLIIHARHEARQDEHGSITREFTRQYVLPRDVDPNTVTTLMTRDGVLTLKAPKIPPTPPEEHSIAITCENGDK